MSDDPKPTLLVVDDERNTREGLRRAFRHKYEVVLAGSGEEGLAALKGNSVDVICVDLRMPKMDGLEFIRMVNAKPHPPLIILFTAYGTVQIADQAMKEGAYDYLTKPLNLDNLEMVIDRGLETRRLKRENQRFKEELDGLYSLDQIVGCSDALSTIFDTVRQVATAKTTVLLTGESGTGKELIAHAVHGLSGRRTEPFIVVHCASLNPNLLESELFGHEKGSFTGAGERHIGRFEKAHKGTLFLDEIGELDVSTQIKLLRVLETQKFERVGGNKPIETDTRLITATNRNLKEMVERGEFREDLFYRLNVLSIHIPPLRERSADIPPLLNHFLKVFATENGKKIGGFSSEAMKILTTYTWPGNVRELRNCVERMVVMARGSILTLGDVPADIRGAAASRKHDERRQKPGNAGEPAGTLDINMNEKNLIQQALDQCGGNRTRASEQLGISRRTLHRKLKTYGLS